MYENKLNRQWNPCKICKWGDDSTTQEEFNCHCECCNDLASEFEESNEFKQFKIGVAISKAAKEIEKVKEKTRIYPLVILCTKDVKEKFKEIKVEDAYDKGLEIIFIDSIYELEGYSNKYYNTYNPTPVFIVEDSIKVRDWIYSKQEIMDNWKVFTCFPNFNNNVEYNLNSDPVQDYYKTSKKEILNLKLDRRFDQIALDKYSDLGYKLDYYKLMPIELTKKL